MPFNLPVAKKGAGAPEVEDGLALWRFDDLILKEHEDWAGTDQYGHEDDGQRFHFVGTIVDTDGAEEYAIIDGENSGDPLELEAVTRTATGEKSNFRKILSGILTAAELKAWDEATEDAPFDGSAAQRRIINVKIGHSKKGWPFIESTIGPAKVKAK
jgi:hypothetical protein